MRGGPLLVILAACAATGAHALRKATPKSTPRAGGGSRAGGGGARIGVGKPPPLADATLTRREAIKNFGLGLLTGVAADRLLAASLNATTSPVKVPMVTGYDVVRPLYERDEALSSEPAAVAPAVAPSPSSPPPLATAAAPVLRTPAPPATVCLLYTSPSPRD